MPATTPTQPSAPGDLQRHAEPDRRLRCAAARQQKRADPGSQADAGEQRPHPARQRQEFAAGQSLPHISDQRRHDQNGRRLRRRHHQAEYADGDRRQAKAYHALDQARQHIGAGDDGKY
jgi:hypothetical protein